jgi:hypothetical protein
MPSGLVNEKERQLLSHRVTETQRIGKTGEIGKGSP